MSNDLINKLAMFTGSEVVYKHSIVSDIIYTDGIKFLCEEAGAYWFLDMVALYQLYTPVNRSNLQVWNIKVHEDSTATITVSDGNYNQLYKQSLKYTDFPIKDFTIWFKDNTIFLLSEY